MRKGRHASWVTAVAVVAACNQPNLGPSTGANVTTSSESDSVSLQERSVVPTLDELWGHVDPAMDSSFAELPARMSSRRGLFLRLEAHEAFVSMHDSARADGIQLTALSATRSFAQQASIWNRKWARPEYMGWSDIEKARDILKYSSMPGSSRHHWGTDVDIHSLEPEDFWSGEGALILEWLRTNAWKFGYAEVYTSDSSRTGYQPEAWHWSYFPLARPYLQAINKATKSQTFPHFSGFDGAHTADTLNIVTDYINGVNAQL